MKRLNHKDWESFKRYLGDKVVNLDVAKLEEIISRTLNDKEKKNLTSKAVTNDRDAGTPDFDPADAFSKLTARLKRDNLL